jgi:hypothetical protein
LEISGNNISPSDTMKVYDEPRSSETVLEAIIQARRVFREYYDTCKRVDRILSMRPHLLGSAASISISDNEYDLFWASMEILKPAIYAKPPRIVVSPRFKDGGPVQKTVADLMERVLNSEFERSNIDEVMLEMRDDLAITNRGVDWITYEVEDGQQKVCIEHLDREDFLHEPARKWSEVSWVARCAYMTRKQMADRFREWSGQAYENADFNVSFDKRENGSSDDSMKAAVWEVWSKADKKVYWVTAGVNVFLDEDEPHLSLDEVFPCPRPAYGTKTRRSLIPVPDYQRYEALLDQINAATIKIYDLLRQVRMFGLIPAGGDVGNAIQTALSDGDPPVFQLIPVPSAAIGATSGAMAVWWPIEQIAATITGLIQARQQLFDDFYQLSGISDIMRGATQAEETLGAQRLKGQYGSIRIKDKVDELVRVARDTACIAAEIICDNFTEDSLLEISQMEIPRKRDLDKKLKEIEGAAKAELLALGEKAEAMAPMLAEAPEEQKQAAQQELQQAQQAIVAKYAPLLQEIRNAVPLEDVMKIIRDKRTRAIMIDVETDSTVMVDEAQEKQARGEFLTAFGNASATIQPLLAAGESGAKLAGAMLKFALQPFNANRELDALIDDFVETAPQLAQQGQGDGEVEAMAAANNKLAEAEMAKAQAQTAKVEADAQLKAVELQRKMQEMQFKAQQQQIKDQLEAGKLRGQLAEQEAKINKLQAETAEILARIGLDARKQNLEEYRASNEVQQREVDTAIRVGSEMRAERGEDRADRQQQFSEASTERQMTMQEKNSTEQGER